MGEKVVAFLQARTDSTRLAGKVLMPIIGKPMIVHQLVRVKKSKKIDKLILLTSDESSDDELARIIYEAGFTVFRGSKENVLERFFKCANELHLKETDIIVRLTGDCPLHDPEIIDELISFFESTNADYAANCIQPIYPDGFDAEVFTFKTLKHAFTNASKSSQKEHVTPYIRDCGLFSIAHLIKESSHTDWRLTVDEAEDFKLISIIFEHFSNNSFSYNKIVKFLENHPNLLEMNMSFVRNEGYEKSLRKDAERTKNG